MGEGVNFHGGLASMSRRSHLALMSAALDLVDHRFGRLVAKKFSGRRVRNHRLWLCACDCGNEVYVETGNLQSGNTESCGCLNVDRLRESNTIHGLSDHPLYATWKGMRQRCLNAHNPNFKHYGGRGVTICDRWDDFTAFVDDMGDRPEGHTLDRKDTNGNYEPGNCRWLPRVDQPRNRRPFVSANQLKTHCKFGHPFDEKNTTINSCSGGRQCRTCNNERAKAKRDLTKTQHLSGADLGNH